MTRRFSAQSSWPGYVPAIHVFRGVGAVKTWMPGTRPGTTINSKLAVPGRDMRELRYAIATPTAIMVFQFPDLPGVITAGSDLDEARKMAAEALAFHLKGMAEDGETVPELSSLEEIMAIAENKDGVAVLIDAPEAEVKSVRINVTIPADVLDQIDRYAEREGFTRSGFLAQAAKKAMAV